MENQPKPQSAYKALKSNNISLKIHFLYSPLDFSTKNIGAVLDEHGERFNQDTLHIERRYNRKRSGGMIADFCWSFCHETPINNMKTWETTK